MISKHPDDSSEKKSINDLEQATENNSSTIGIDETFEILKNNRRRTVLNYLRRHDGSATLKELADHVTAEENDTDIASITSSQRKRVYVGLYQFHLPKMGDMNIIDYDKHRGTVSLTDKGVHICEIHENQQDSEGPGEYLYIAIAGFGVVGVAVSLAVWETLVVFFLFAIFTLILSGVAIYQLYQSSPTA